MKIQLTTLLFLAATASQTPAQVLDFEAFTTGGIPAEGGILAAQFKTSHGVSFSLEGGGFPVFAEVGAPRTAFDGPGGAADLPNAGQGTGSFFLTDDGVANAAPIPVIIDYVTPASVVGGDLIDIDGTEAWEIQARDASDAIVSTLTLAAGDPGTGDGVSTRWSIVRPQADIHSVKLVYVGTQTAVGWALDRLSQSLSAVSYCTAGVSASGCQATLSATGTPSASASSGFVVSATAVEGSKDGLFFYGINGRQANPWGNGTSLQCIVPPVQRTGLLVGTGTNGACDGSFARDLNAFWCSTCTKPSANPGLGTTTNVQLWYRDPLNTSNRTTSLSDALEFELVP